MPKKTRNKFLLLLLVGCSVFAQTPDFALRGKIIIECPTCSKAPDQASAAQVNILNSRTQQTAVSNENGLFRIGVKLGDLLIISSFNLDTKRKYIRPDDVKDDLLLLKMNLTENQLEEVKVGGESITTESVGIPGATREYTPAERKVRTATTGLLDPLFNKLSGRTKMLKKQVLVEKNERLLLKLDGLYEDKYYTDVLMIPNDYIGGFQYYIVEDPDFARALEEKNKTLTMFYIKKLAVDYVNLIQVEQAQEAADKAKADAAKPIETK